MKLVDNYMPLVIVGAWNKAIFTPQWVSEFVFNKAEVQVQFPIDDFTRSSMRFSANGIAFNIFEQRLQFNALKQEGDTYESIGEAALKICRMLCHTPLTSFGINHIFECAEEEVKGKLAFLDLLNAEINPIGAVNGLGMQYLIQMEDCELNLNIRKGDGIIKFDFNYNHPIISPNTFASCFESANILAKKIESERLLENIFGLTL